jgi:hypothetical protein
VQQGRRGTGETNEAGASTANTVAANNSNPTASPIGRAIGDLVRRLDRHRRREGAMQTIRKGTNGWTCMPDNPVTPGPDPMCFDENAGKWVQAWIGHKPPPENVVGLMYMLEGGTDASNTDPYATKPTAREQLGENPTHYGGRIQRHSSEPSSRSKARHGSTM